METNVQTRTGNPQDHKYLTFQLNQDSGYFDMIQGELGFNKIPIELKIEPTQEKEIIHAENLIRSKVKDKNGKFIFFTGLLPTPFEYWYFGDFYEKRNGIKRNSFILFHFSQDQTRFEMFFFNHFKLYPDRRGHFIRDFITHLKR